MDSILSMNNFLAIGGLSNFDKVTVGTSFAEPGRIIASSGSSGRDGIKHSRLGTSSANLHSFVTGELRRLDSGLGTFDVGVDDLGTSFVFALRTFTTHLYFVFKIQIISP